MNSLQDRILKDGKVFPNNVLKVDSFMNHQIDPVLVKAIASEFYETFQNAGITKILTIEASGIAPALLTAEQFGVPMLFAKKTQPSTLSQQDVYATDVHSYTKNVTSRVMVSQQYLEPSDVVLIIDDFLANGEAALGLMDLVKQAGARVAGIGICIEKSFQKGRKLLEDQGVQIHSICRIASLDNETITFVQD